MCKLNNILILMFNFSITFISIMQLTIMITLVIILNFIPKVVHWKVCEKYHLEKKDK